MPIEEGNHFATALNKCVRATHRDVTRFPIVGLSQKSHIVKERGEGTEAGK
jgi:hypothetical protein